MMDAHLPAHVDLMLLAHNMGGNTKVIPKLFAAFQESCDSCTLRMETALQHNDTKEWQAAAHALKGAALSVTAKRIALRCEDAEHMFSLNQSHCMALMYHLHKDITVLRSMVAAQIGNS